MRLRRIAIITFTVIASILLVWVFTPATIIPPAHPVGAITVHVLDLGFHPELVLPNNGEFIVYAYGDWNYFALNQQTLRDGLAALFLPTQGALGRRTFSNLEQLQQMVKEQDLELLSFQVSQVEATKLLQSLDTRFNRNIETQIQNPQTKLSLVQDEQEYTILHNSNHELIDWLEELGCEVRGFVIWSNFRLQQSN